MKNPECLSINLPEDILKLKVNGDFEHARKIIDIYMKKNIPEILKDRLEFEKIIMDKIKNDYIYTFDEALSLMQKTVKDFTKEEFLKLKDGGFIDWIFIDGKVKFNESFLRNVIKTYPKIKERLVDSRKIDESEKKKQDKFLDNVINEIIENGSKTYYVHMKSTIKLTKNSNTGKVIRVYIPVPASCSQLRNIKIISTSPKAKFISPEDYPQRTVYFEKEVSGEDEFSVEYSYENHVEYKEMDPNKVSCGKTDFYTEELPPHIVFTPYIKALANKIVKDEKNPLEKARKIYDYITTNVKYSYVREYLTIENISEYTALNLKGDCGLQALLFITLCRCVKVPARWQSGLSVSPFSVSNHDWAQFYVEPYGWLFADPAFGVGAYRDNDEKMRKFYFGNIDPFRMVANSEFQYDLLPEKKFVRSDPYDNQRGECEYLDRPLYFDEFEVARKVIEIYEK